jgi:small subunit ribosomal protein S18
VSKPLRFLSQKNNDEPIQMKNPFQKEKVKCVLCRHNIKPNYKNVELLSQFQSPYTGRIYGRHITGLCKKMQEIVETEIGKAQNIGMMGIMTKEVTFLKDPKLYDPEKPIRPHKY